jgi:hypothetical protein
MESERLWEILIRSISEAVLNMDCAGCEYYLINEKPETLKKFRQIQIEYHHGFIQLVDKLKDSGFNVKYSKPKKFGLAP